MRHVTFRHLSRPLAAIGALRSSDWPAPRPPLSSPSRRATVATNVGISWEVKNRFRLFRDAKDFTRHVAVTGAGGILAAEQALAQETAGRGWARDMVARLCVDGAGRILATCQRDGVRESYLAPVDQSGVGPAFGRWSRPTRPVGGRSTMAKARPRR